MNELQVEIKDVKEELAVVKEELKEVKAEHDNWKNKIYNRNAKKCVEGKKCLNVNFVICLSIQRRV